MHKTIVRPFQPDLNLKYTSAILHTSGAPRTIYHELNCDSAVGRRGWGEVVRSWGVVWAEAPVCELRRHLPADPVTRRKITTRHDTETSTFFIHSELHGMHGRCCSSRFKDASLVINLRRRTSLYSRWEKNYWCFNDRVVGGTGINYPCRHGGHVVTSRNVKSGNIGMFSILLRLTSIWGAKKIWKKLGVSLRTPVSKFRTEHTPTTAHFAANKNLIRQNICI